MSWTNWITATINVSKSDENEHYTPEQVVAVFNKNPDEINLDSDFYILKSIFTESPLQATYNFFIEAGIDYNQAKELYLFLKSKGINDDKFGKYDWYFGV